MTTDLEKADSIIAALTKKFGKDIAVKANELVEKEVEVLSISPNVDIGLNGGIPKGCIAVLSGKPKIGKTTTILHMAKKAQEAGNFVYYINAEARLKKRDILGIPGIDANKIVVIEATPDKVLTAEDFLNIAEGIFKDHEGAVVLFDSLSAICSMKEGTDELTGQARNLGPKLIASFLRRSSQIIKVNKISFVAIQHLIANTSGYGAAFLEDGGNKIMYAAETKMRATKMEKWKVGEEQISGS